jgi:hypothetical protein
MKPLVESTRDVHRLLMQSSSSGRISLRQAMRPFLRQIETETHPREAMDL